MSIHITEFADKKIGEILEKSDRKGYLLRAGVSGGGCSGLSYVFDFVKNPDDNDKVFSFANISICVDKKSYLYLNGMTIDYEGEQTTEWWIDGNNFSLEEFLSNVPEENVPDIAYYLGETGL